MNLEFLQEMLWGVLSFVWMVATFAGMLFGVSPYTVIVIYVILLLGATMTKNTDKT